MTFRHAVAWTDHQRAEILSFDDTEVQAHRLHAHSHPTGQHGSAVRTEHEFYAALCDALDTLPQVLLTGSRVALADFRHYVEKHRPKTATRLVGFEVVDHPTDKQLVALARTFFVEFDRMAGTASPT